MRLPARDTETMPDGFEEALRRAFLEPPSPAAEESHLTRMAAADADSRVAATKPTPSAGPVPASPLVPARVRLAALLAALVLALPVMFAGLALAGVRLPDAIDSAFESVGIDLPNQSPDDDGEPEAPAGGGVEATPGDEEDRGDAAVKAEGRPQGDESGGASRKDSNGGPSNASEGDGNESSGRPAHAQDGQTGAPPHSEQGGQGVGTPPAHAQDGVGGPPPHAQGNGSQQPQPAKPLTPKREQNPPEPRPVKPKPEKPRSTSESDE
jgi:hypothetical protein